VLIESGMGTTAVHGEPATLSAQIHCPQKNNTDFTLNMFCPSLDMWKKTEEKTIMIDINLWK
jgi:hypothetical protein